MGKLLVAIGLGLAALGALILLAERIPGLRLGRLPGDIAIQKDGFGFFFPITTMILLSAIASLALWVLGRWRR